jgi:uncharacterized OsmC-like protein
MNMQTKIAKNGVNTEALIGARGAFEQMPEAALFTFRSTCDWIEGTYSRSSIADYFGLGQDHQRKRSFSIESDHPEVFAAADRAPTPPEIVLSALASCLTGGLAAVAQHRGMDPEIRNGFSAIRVKFDIDADASKQDIDALVAQSQKRSAVFDILTNPTNVVVSVD